MGPRPFRRGNPVFAACQALTLVPLQWGHVLSDVEMDWHPVDIIAGVWLQWGHVLSDVEIFLVSDK